MRPPQRENKGDVQDENEVELEDEGEEGGFFGEGGEDELVEMEGGEDEMVEADEDAIWEKLSNW